MPDNHSFIAEDRIHDFAATPENPDDCLYCDEPEAHAIHGPRAVAPSSPTARARGCTCLGGDTPDGNGLDSTGPVTNDAPGAHWVIATNCPVHARNLPEVD